MANLRVAIIAPPWLALPIKGYGGIELVLEGLVEGLRHAGVEVEIFGNGFRSIRGVKTHSLYKTEQYSQIHKPMYESLPIIIAHMQFSLNAILKDGGFDIIHDHNGFIGPALLYWATQSKHMPPAVSTWHGPPFSNKQTLDTGMPDNIPMWRQIGSPQRSFMIGISETLMKPAPKEMKASILDPVYNAINTAQFPFVEHKKNYYITLARFSRDKGQHTAAKICDKLGLRLRMAGTIAGIETNQKLLLELANPMSVFRSAEDFRYYSDKVLPYTVNNRKITYAGNVSGQYKMKFISEAKALLFPIDWEEPFGMAVIEALACGTPVVAMKRGAMPEIIEHGKNGFLANTKEEFADYVLRVGEIDPKVCRESVEKNFSSDVMAQRYIERYKEAIKLAKQAGKAKK